MPENAIYRIALFLFSSSALVASAAENDALDPLMRTVDLNVGQSARVQLRDGTNATVKLLKMVEERDDLRQAVRRARVTVEVNGQETTLTSANYNLPVELGDVQIDCAVTKGCVQADKNPWALDADARFRLWPAGSKWIRPETFVYPVRQRWFASDTQMSNEPTFVNGGESPARKSIYYHWGLDFGGAEGLVEILAATNGTVVSARTETLDSLPEGTPVNPRYDVVYIRDSRGWYYRYSHLQTIDESIRPGTVVKMGQRLGLLGKEGGSGGWTHLHLDISAMQPSGRFGIVEGYAFVWQVYHDRHKTRLQAVARPHHLIWTGQTVTHDGSRSFSIHGPAGITDHEWTFTDGTTARGAKVQRRYDRVGEYSEILKLTDKDGRTDYDFSRVLVIDPEHPEQLPPAIHVVYYPTFDVKPGDEITFKVRSFALAADDGQEEWDFGDGSPMIQTQSDGNAVTRAPDGYAVTTHRYQKPGQYLVRVQRSNHRGETAIGHVYVCVGAAR